MYDISRSIFDLMLRTLFVPEFFGRENLPEPPFIVASNHGSNMDPAVIGSLCSRYRIDFMAKKELFDVPFLGGWAAAVGAIPVARGKNSIRGIKETLRRLKEGRVVGVFPEGTRSSDGDIRNARLGTGFLIKKAGVPVVPFYIAGSHEAWPKGDRMRPGSRLAAIAGEPVLPSDLPSDGGDARKAYSQAVDLLMEQIVSLKEQLEKKNICTRIENAACRR